MSALQPALLSTIACLLALLWGGVALAHPQIVAVEPAPNAKLSTSPPIVAITFNEAIEDLSILALYTAQGALIRDGGRRDPANPTRLALSLPTLDPGLYTVVWTAAGSDGHVVRGNFAFSVLEPTTSSAAPVAATTMAATPVAPVAPPVTAGRGTGPHRAESGTLGAAARGDRLGRRVGLLAGVTAPRPILVPTVTPGPTATLVPSRPFDETKPAGDLLVRLAVAPASLGDNRFQITVTDAAGQPVATQRVRLAFAMQEMDMGVQELEAPPADGATFSVTGSPLSMVGHWQITVLVRRAGLNDVTALFTVPVGQ